MPIDRRTVFAFVVAMATFGSVGASRAEAVSPAAAEAAMPAAVLAAPLAPWQDATAQDTVRTDLIDYGSGAFPLRADDGLLSTAARAVLDGIPGFLALPGLGSEGPEEPVVLLVELPAPTTFTSFAVPPMSRFGCCYGTHIKTVTVEGSATSPDEGFETLVTFDVVVDVYDADQEFPATASPEVRWLRISLAGRQVVDPDDYHGTTFTDLRGYGQQAPREAAPDEFTGIFLTGGGGSGPNANRIEFVQNGALVTGCRQSGGAFGELSGGIENGILKVLAGDGIPSLYLINSEGRLLGVEVGRSYQRIIGEPGGNPTPCSPTTGEAVNGVGVALDACEAAVVYGVNFDVDSDVLREDSGPALEQILAALEARPELTVTVEGHTDSDATEAYNLDLSQRRAASVVAWLVERGVGADRLTALGVGEAQPIADNATAAGKAANRRVEIRPSC